ncbi:MBL fold metallo-hydrolase [Anaerobacillus alkaliphilus]|uniref:MBL fold metallo-hydrolase n=1 Tax=Anaerobacillus alkaliphilus TaxID=1548597 RepID=A0A4Q0VYK5_9BACI|nr:MBL fold metallo-hydrolase [Anaerobacillus alkaliphilus]RXJ04540.1 MBL fold metallo-hydrolase [Anaerobacillus alkaliphilus]
MFKKKFEQKAVNGVQMGNGTISFRGVTLNVHSFFLDGVLIDTGAKSLDRFFKSFFSELDIKKVVITHFHEDHTGCASYLQEDLQKPVFMDDAKLQSCTNKADYPLYRQLFWGRRKPFYAEVIGEIFYSQKAKWQVIKTPGHAIDHLAFLNDETGQLFTGDLYCQKKTKVVLRDESVPMIINSLKRILTYDFGDVFCSHAGYLSDGRTALEEKLEYLLELEGNILKLHDEGKGLREINRELFPKKHAVSYFSSGEWDSFHIVKSIIAQNKTLIS